MLSAERIGHPRRERKPEFKEGRCPPLDVPTCSPLSISVWSRLKFGVGPKKSPIVIWTRRMPIESAINLNQRHKEVIEYRLQDFLFHFRNYRLMWKSHPHNSAMFNLYCDGLAPEPRLRMPRNCRWRMAGCKLTM
jgi:hypothetical protein